MKIVATIAYVDNMPTKSHSSLEQTTTAKRNPQQQQQHEFSFCFSFIAFNFRFRRVGVNGVCMCVRERAYAKDRQNTQSTQHSSSIHRETLGKRERARTVSSYQLKSVESPSLSCIASIVHSYIVVNSYRKHGPACMYECMCSLSVLVYICETALSPSLLSVFST